MQIWPAICALRLSSLAFSNWPNSFSTSRWSALRRKATATVAGAGALGLSSAMALAEAGFAVTVCDPGPAFANASAVAGGMVAPSFEAVLDAAAAPHFDLLLAARNLWPDLEAR